ncbi:hypothetical protein OGAPHI_004209 [Ogataea philodendri]|uniref:RRM domain-containing protein n=1 Tax=Ogataea philodendri TaxID=1378263 RepID=A0A9P8T5E3_9ASCO|nr:uncharacterized protein OGAPHI_004209 [Ogataea philodendri]KAH3666020.1 hypothetical protein OGAPHI_004209 [Ogataea philodendri]
MGLIEDIQGIAPENIPEATAQYLSFDKVRLRWTIEIPDSGDEYEYNPILERWVPLLDEAEPPKHSNDEDDLTEAFKKQKREKLKQLRHEREQDKLLRRHRNTCIYVSQLPLDIDYDELDRIFGKYGVLAEDFRTGLHKIKLYKDDNGNFKGDCLIEYLKEESCDLAIELLHDTKLRGTDEHPISVTTAEFGTKSDKKPATKLNVKERLQLKKKVEKIHKKVNEWSDNEDDDDKTRLRDEKIVVFKHCFTLKELSDDPATLLDVKEDIREGCEEIGEVTNVVLYDLEPEGVVTVRFKSAVAAQNCVSKMNGRFFGGQRLEVFKYDGETQYKRSRSDNSEQERLSKFGDWLDN